MIEKENHYDSELFIKFIYSIFWHFIEYLFCLIILKEALYLKSLNEVIYCFKE